MYKTKTKPDFSLLSCIELISYTNIIQNCKQCIAYIYIIYMYVYSSPNQPVVVKSRKQKVWLCCSVKLNLALKNITTTSPFSNKEANYL